MDERLRTYGGIAVGIALLVSFAYAVVTLNIFLWLFWVLLVGFAAFVLYLFYRLVVAVEEIAAKM